MAAQYGDRGVWGAAGVILRTEGIRGFYRGYLPKVARLGPGSAIIFVVYERVMGLLADSGA